MGGNVPSWTWDAKCRCAAVTFAACGGNELQHKTSSRGLSERQLAPQGSKVIHLNLVAPQQVTIWYHVLGLNTSKHILEIWRHF